MKEFYQSPVTYTPSLLFATFMFGSMGIAAIATASPYMVVIGILFLGGLAGIYWFLFILVRRPTVRVAGHEIYVRGLMGRMHHIANVREYSLVVSKDWMGFRRADRGDIMLEQRRFPKRVWSDLEQELRRLPFANIE
ncbi:hypothetical protein [Porticoccus sp.]